MKKILAALLLAGLTGSAFAAAVTPATKNSDHHRAAAVPLQNSKVVPGAHLATTQSLGELKPYGAIIGIAVVGAVVAASSSNSHHTAGTTGTTP